MEMEHRILDSADEQPAQSVKLAKSKSKAKSVRNKNKLKKTKIINKFQCNFDMFLKDD